MADKRGKTDEAEPSPAATDPAEPPPTAELADILKRERDDYHDRWLRKTAEFDNYRRRVDRERREQADQAVVDLLQDVLLVVDDFDRALTIEAGDDAGAYRKGIELIHAKLHDLLRRQGVTAMEVVGTDFDPNVHQAVVHEPSTDHREGEIIDELRRGYLINGRLLRPAMVKVAKA
jgi:molecular chaperone GrpE